MSNEETKYCPLIKGTCVGSKCLNHRKYFRDKFFNLVLHEDMKDLAIYEQDYCKFFDQEILLKELWDKEAKNE